MFLKLMRVYELFFEKLQKWSEPFYALVLRLYLFNDFFNSGKLKVQYIWNGQWETVIFLFQEEYKVPLLSPAIAAAMGTFNEVVFSILIVLGLFARLAGLVLFLTALLIQLTYMQDANHLLWMVASFYIMIRGGGWISVDYLIHKKMEK